jgi:UDP-2,3-diacylglucosamine pyrophosphatase LpxH
MNVQYLKIEDKVVVTCLCERSIVVCHFQGDDLCTSVEVILEYQTVLTLTNLFPLMFNDQLSSRLFKGFKLCSTVSK